MDLNNVTGGKFWGSGAFCSIFWHAWKAEDDIIFSLNTLKCKSGFGVCYRELPTGVKPVFTCVDYSLASLHVIGRSSSTQWANSVINIGER